MKKKQILLSNFLQRLLLSAGLSLFLIAGLFAQTNYPIASGSAALGSVDIGPTCNCISFLNIYSGLNDAGPLLVHALVEVTAPAGNVWTYDKLLGGGVLNAAGTPISTGTDMTEVAPGVYQFEFWHKPADGYSAEFASTDADGAGNPGIATITTSCALCANVVSQTDYDGDGSPDILDPCDCNDPMNKVDGSGQVTHLHDFILVANTGQTGATYTLFKTGGDLFDTNLNPITTANLTEISPEVYRIDFWFVPGTMYEVQVDVGGILFAPLTNSCPSCPAATIPTMGEWGLIILALLVLCFATVFMMRRQTAIAGMGNVSMSGTGGIPFDKASYTKMLVTVMIGLAVVFAVAVSLFGYEMTNADVPGSLIAGPVLAYLLHLMFSKK